MAWPLSGKEADYSPPFHEDFTLMSHFRSTIGQSSFYKSISLAQQGEPGYSRTADYLGAFNGKGKKVLSR